MSGTLAVNQHYLDRVVAVADATGVEATEDIVAGNGLKLVAKGARIDARVRERLLAHRLIKPLESMLRVTDGIPPGRLDAQAQELLDTRPLVASVCGRGAGRAVVSALRHLQLSTPVESLLAVYRRDAPDRLAHAVGVALLAGALGPDAGAAALPPMVLAGLLHDVGELYIDPELLKSGRRLSAGEMKHIAAHPLIAGHLLRDMAGAGVAIAGLVQQHHERRDGFGYPFGLTADRLPAAGQALAVAEIVMGLVESGRAAAERAAVAMKLIPGEFDRALMDRVVRAAGAAPADEAARGGGGAVPSGGDLASRIASLRGALRSLDELARDSAASLRGASAPLRSLVDHAVERCVRISRAFSSAGLDTHDAERISALLDEAPEATRFEADVVIRELEWRLREVKRELRRRAEPLDAAERDRLDRLVEAARTGARDAHATASAAMPETGPESVPVGAAA